MARTGCDCPNPPGGRVECDPDQAAYCIVDDEGRTESGCLSIRTRWTNKEQLPDGVVREVAGHIRRVIEEIDDTLEGQIRDRFVPGKPLVFDFMNAKGRKFRVRVALPEDEGHNYPPTAIYR